MNHPTSRRTFLKGMLAGAVVLGFDPHHRSWVTAAQAQPSFVDLPPFDGELHTDSASRAAAADDFGHIVQREPLAVLKPGSVEDIVRMVRFARQYGIQVAARGQGHSAFGQMQVAAGVVIDMSTLNTIHSIDGDRAVVDAGALWSDLLKAALPRNLRPPVLTDFIELSIGGTLALGGIGGTSYRYGAQVDTALELEVVTGEGQREVCSATHNRDLFEATLAGLGQCAIIVRATLRLVPAASSARFFRLFYSDLATFTRDQRLLIADGRFDHVGGQGAPNGSGGWTYILEAANFFTPPAAPDNARLLAGLSYTPGSAQIVDRSFFDFANRFAAVVAAQKANGTWYYPHPRFGAFVPAATVDLFVSEVWTRLDPNDAAAIGILLYPMPTARFTHPLMRLPDDRDAFFYILNHTAKPNADAVSRVVANHYTIYQRGLELGITRYPFDAIPFSRHDWQRHFQPYWGRLVSTKRRYDPDNLLTPGQGIF
ncbi:MAG TPA: FAD-binding protein [Herpetosiphonaceae bacterium]